MCETPRVHRETVGTELVDTSSASLHASVNTGGPKTPTNALCTALISLPLNIFHSMRLFLLFLYTAVYYTLPKGLAVQLISFDRIFGVIKQIIASDP